MTGPVPMGPGTEFDLVRRMMARWGDIAQGLGDDAAVIDVPGGRRLVVSTDTSTENVHFRRHWLSLEEIGYRATMAALSDLAAMAAEPLSMLLGLTIPGDLLPGAEALADGIGEAALAAACPIVGGDVTRGAILDLTITVLGTAAHAVRRSGASPGDIVHVTGSLGGPGAALRAFREGRSPAAPDRARFARPAARLAEARWLAEHGATAMIDVSDGLSSDAQHLAAASDVALEVDLESLPCVAGVPARQAAASGEEYELLVTAPDELDGQAFASRFSLPLTPIGRVASRGTPGVIFVEEGTRVDLARGYDHFSA